MTFFI